VLAFSPALPARGGGDDSGRGDYPDGVVQRIGDVHGSVGRHRDTERRVEPGCRTRAVEEAGRRATGQCRHDAAGGDFSDAMGTQLTDVEVAGGVDGQAAWKRESGRRGGGVRGAVFFGASRIGRYCARSRNSADGVIQGVGHKDVAAGVDGDASGIVEAGERRGAVDDADVSRTASEGGNDSCRRDLPDRVAVPISDVERAIGSERQRGRVMEARGRAGPVRGSASAVTGKR